MTTVWHCVDGGALLVDDNKYATTKVVLKPSAVEEIPVTLAVNFDLTDDLNSTLPTATMPATRMIDITPMT